MKLRNMSVTFWLVAVMALLFTSVAQARSLPDFTDLVERNAEAVVNISTTQKVKPQGGKMPMPHNMPEIPEGPFGDLFRHFFGEQNPNIEEFNTQSLGSGFFISPDGYVLTNHHVIKDASEVIVRMSDRRELVAEIVGSDERSDVALLKVNADNLPMVELGDSSKLKVGEWVLAIGSPFGFDYSVTAGIVSAKGRSLPRENYVPFIQTDVAINPGNSGGPLFDLDGRVVGVNSQIYSRTGGFMGLSFAIPIDVAMNVVEQLKAKGHVSRGWLGVLIQDVTRELAESFKMDKPRGALVAQVLPDSPAEKAGIRVGDIILNFNGRDIIHSSDLPPMVGLTPVGEKTSVELLREGKSRKFPVVLGELPDNDTTVASAAPAKPATSNRLNVSVQDLSPEQRKQLEVRENGVLVLEVGDGVAKQAGVRRGDVILMIDNKSVANARQFDDLVKALPSAKSVPMLVQRRGSPVFLALKIGG